MEDIKKEKNIHMYFMVSIVLAMFMEIYAFLMRLNLLNIFISFIFYLWNQNHKKKQVNYLIQCCDAIIEQKDFSIIDG